MKLTKVPVKITELITNYVALDSSLNHQPERVKQKFIRKCVELWYFIYTTQISDSTCLSLDFYTNINKDEFTPFEIVIAKKRYKYTKFLNTLNDLNLISINEKYSTGAFSKGYRIETEFLRGSAFTEVDIDFKKVFKNTIDKAFWIKKYPKHKHLIKDCYQVQIDIDRYYNWMLLNEGKELKPTIKDGFLHRRFLDKETILRHLTLVLKVNLGNLWFKVSKEGRFYSSISNLPFTCLEFLRFHKRSVEEFDLKNCQPLLLSILLEGQEQYKHDVESGEFYYKVGQLMFPHYDRDRAKAEFKLLSYRFIFFNDKPTVSGMTYNAMEALYPGIMAQINQIKTNTALARKLQSIESDLFVDKLGSLSFPKLLRHDQILYHKEYDQEIKQALRIELKKLGLNPDLDKK